VLNLPRFPLRAVRFPGALLPLHIFEPRYRELVGDLSVLPAEARSFGILPPGDSAELPVPGAIAAAARAGAHSRARRIGHGSIV
jgi:Lon protease-like protein